MTTIEDESRTAEEIAADALREHDPEAIEEEDDGQILIPGTAPGISMKVGGPKPTASVMRMQGSAIGIEGEFSKEDVVHLLVAVRVEDVSFPSTRDKEGNVTSTKRLHIARPIAITRADMPETE